MTFGDTLALVAIAVAIFLYALERAWERRKEIQAVLGVMTAVRQGMRSSDAGGLGWATAFEHDWGLARHLMIASWRITTR